MKRWTGPIILGLLLAAAGIYDATHMRVTTDVTHFLTTMEDRQQAELVSGLADSELSRTLVVSLGVADAETAARTSALFADKMRAHPEVAWLENGVRPDVEQAVYELYFPRRFSFVPPETAKSFATDDGLAAAAAALKQMFADPMGAALKKLAPDDPLMLFAALLKRFDAARPGDLDVVDGRFVTKDQRHAIIFLGTKHSPLDAAAQEPLLAALEEARAEVENELSQPVQLERSGIHMFGVQGRAAVESDIARISIVSMVSIVVLFLWLYRSLVLFMLANLPLIAGLGAGLAVGLLLFGSVHGLTLAFASTLIGVCIDYPIHYFSVHVLQPVGRTAEQSLGHTWSGLWLGALTTFVGFAALAASGLPGLSEVGIVSATGVIAAIAVTRFALPVLAPPVKKDLKHALRLARAFERWIGAAARHRGVLLALAVGSVVIGLASLPFMRVSGDLAALMKRDPALVAEDKAVRERISGVEPGRVVVALGATEEDALTANALVAAKLQGLKDAGKLGAYRSLQSFLWSRAAQERSRAAFEPALGARVERTFVAAGFRERSFTNFDAALATRPEPLTFDTLMASPLASIVRPFKIQIEGAVGFLTFLQDVKDPDALKAALVDVPSARYIDQRQFMNEAYSDYRERAGLAIGFGLIAILVLVAVRYRSRDMFLMASLPAVGGVGLTLAFLTFTGTELDLLHLVSLLLVSAMGIDYGIFIAESRHEPGPSLVGVSFASLTTLLGFGLLAFSDNPAMHSIGVTITVGIIVTVLLAPCALLILERRRS